MFINKTSEAAEELKCGNREEGRCWVVARIYKFTMVCFSHLLILLQYNTEAKIWKSSLNLNWNHQIPRENITDMMPVSSAAATFGITIVAWRFKNHFNSVFIVCAVSGAGCCKDTNTVELCAVFLLSKNQKASFPLWLNYQWLASERSFTSLYFITRRPTGLCNTTVQTQTHLVYA